MSTNFLSKNDELRKGDYLLSNNGNWKAVFQGDSNFVIYGWQAVWASDTNGVGAFRLCMQGNCNLVMYNDSDGPLWVTNSAKLEANMCRLQLTDDGTLEVYREAERIWSSADSTGMKI